jgi:hypothetical protein
MPKSKKKNIKVRDLNPKKDAKGGSVQSTSKLQSSSMTGSSMQGAAATGSSMTGTGKVN